MRRSTILPCITLAAVITASATATAVAHNKSGFRTTQPSMLAPVKPGVTTTPLLTVRDRLSSGYRFESIPDGISVRTRGRGRVDLFVNHETGKVPFPYVTADPTAANGENDFDNAQVSQLRLNQHSAGVLGGSFVIPSSRGYQRFCSNYLATSKEGFSRQILFTNEESPDYVFRQEDSWPPPIGDPAEREAGLVVAMDVRNRKQHPIYGMGRHNHENSVAIPGYGHPVVLSGDDTFTAPSSQLYLYTADSAAAVWNDTGSLWAFKSDVPTVNDYGDMTVAGAVPGRFIAVPRAIATGDQTALETWSNANGVFQFIRVEDIAYDRTTPNIVYFADTGEPRAVPGPGAAYMTRGPATFRGPYMNGRLFKLVLDPADPTRATLSIAHDADAGGYGNANAIHQLDNL